MPPDDRGRSARLSVNESQGGMGDRHSGLIPSQMEINFVIVRKATATLLFSR